MPIIHGYYLSEEVILARSNLENILGQIKSWAPLRFRLKSTSSYRKLTLFIQPGTFHRGESRAK